MRLFRGPRNFEFPGPDDRVAIAGATGSGKSTFGLWLLAEGADFDKKPYVLVDYKGEVIINELLASGVARKIELHESAPKTPGIYVLKPGPQDQEEMATWLWKVWRSGKVGLFFDELSMVPNFDGAGRTGGPLKSILTQGRSKEIPVYGLTQRPVGVNISVFSEAQFIVAFKLKKTSDKERVAEYIPDDVKLFDKRAPTLPPHWSRWWDDKRDIALTLRPSPPAETVLDIFETRVDAMRQRSRL